MFLVFGVLLGVFISQYVFPSKSQTEKINPPPPPSVSGLNSQLGDLPECELGHCPVYLNTPWYIYPNEVGGLDPSTLLTVPVGMNKGAGQLWVIHDGNVVYKSPTFSEIIAKLDNNKLYITSYKILYEPNNITVGVLDTYSLIYKDNQFDLQKVTSSSKNL